MKRPCTTGHEVERLVHAGLMREKVAHAGDFVAGDVDEEDVGQLGRSGLVQIAQECRLHEVDGEDEHDAGSQRSEHGSGLVSGAIEIGEAVAKERGKTQTDAIEKEAQERQRQCGEDEQTQ